jgi:apolipoprotein N-acyltransferase
MNTVANDVDFAAATEHRGAIATDRLRYAWLALGTLLSMFAVGGRWDLPFAAWLYAIFLLRFSRTSTRFSAIGGVWLASLIAAFFWAWQLDVPMQTSTVAGSIFFATVLTVPYALDRLLVARATIVGALVLFPAARTACEYAMGAFSPLGAAYGLSAVTQSDNLPLLQVISVTGPYAIGFLFAWLATTVNCIWQQPGLSRRNVRVAFSYAVVVVVVTVGGGIRLAFFPPTADYVRVAAIAPSIPNAARVTSDPAIDEEFLANSRVAARAGAKIVTWSENAVVLASADAEPAFIARAADVARSERIYLNVADNLPRVHDETHLIDPNGRVAWSYRKARPIPGLEVYAPGEGAVPVVDTPHGRLANVICYDADFPGVTRAAADILLVPGGDWPAIGAVHTLKMARLRAIEHGYSLIRSDVNGLSAAFDHQGRVLATQDTTTVGQHVMFADVPTRGVATIYRSIGDAFAWLCVVVCVVVAGTRRRRAKIEASVQT